MTQAIPDLWPTDFRPLGPMPPAAILREQAEHLGAKTANRITAEVKCPAPQTNRLEYHLDLVAPPLGNYRYRLLSIRHGLPYYPLELFADVPGSPLRASSEEEYVRALREVLSSDETRRVVGSLLTQILGLAKSKGDVPPSGKATDE
jgi:hypothetical protein